MGQGHEPRSLRPRLILDLAAIHFRPVKIDRVGQRASYVAPAGITEDADLARWVEAGAYAAVPACVMKALGNQSGTGH